MTTQDSFLATPEKDSVGSEVLQHVHVDSPEYGVSLDKVKILTVENKKYDRGVKDVIYIRVDESSLNKHGRRYLLPAVWTNLLKARVCPPSTQSRSPIWFQNVQLNLRKTTVMVERLVK